MRRKKSIPLPNPENAGFEYSCPTATWDGMTRIIPIGDGDDKVDESYKEIFPCRHEYHGESKNAAKQS